MGIPTLAMIDDLAKISVCGVPSVLDNAYINARIEHTKQLFNGTKCHRIHAGRQIRPCSALYAHDTRMDVVNEEKYVGDIVTNDGKHARNISARRSKGVGIIGEIANILDGLCLGPHYFSVAMMLRQTMLVQILLFNSETWLRLADKDLERLEKGRSHVSAKNSPSPYLHTKSVLVPRNWMHSDTVHHENEKDYVPASHSDKTRRCPHYESFLGASRKPS